MSSKEDSCCLPYELARTEESQPQQNLIDLTSVTCVFTFHPKPIVLLCDIIKTMMHWKVLHVDLSKQTILTFIQKAMPIIFKKIVPTILKLFWE